MSIQQNELSDQVLVKIYIVEKKVLLHHREVNFSLLQSDIFISGH